MLTFDEAFGKDARLYRELSASAPFFIRVPGKAKTERKPVIDSENNTSMQDVVVGGSGGGEWRLNKSTGNFDFHEQVWRDHTGENVSGFNAPGPEYAQKPSKSISAKDLGIEDDPAYKIAGLATLAGQNSDSWSNYALTHNNYYGKGVGSHEGVMLGARDLRGAIGDIIKYDRKESFLEKVVPVIILGAGAAMGFAAALGGVGGAVAGAGEIAATGATAAEGVATGATIAEGATLESALAAGQTAAAGTEATLAGAGLSTPISGASVAGTVAAPATTGGAIVGSSGIIPGFGNALVDGALNSAAKNFVISLATSGGDVETALKSAAGGFVTGGVGASLSPATDFTSKVVNAAISGSAGGAVNAALSGGDILKGAATGGATSAAGSAASNYVTELTESKGVGGLAGGAASATVRGLIDGNLDPKKVLNSSLASGAGGFAQDYGASAETAGLISTATGAALNQGNIIGTGVNPADNVRKAGTATTAASSPTVSAPVQQPAQDQGEYSPQGFGVVVPIGYHAIQRRDMNWGNRRG